MTDYNHDPLVPRVGNESDLAAATAHPNEVLWTQDTLKLYVEQDGAKILIGSAALRLVEEVVVATTGDITLANEQTINGVGVVADDRVLVKDQTAPEENGIYDVVAGGAWTRSADANTWAEYVNLYTFVRGGTTDSNTGWRCTALAGGTLESDPLDFFVYFAIVAVAEHAIDGAKHTIGSLTSGRLVQSDGSKLAPATNTNTDVAAAVTASHARQHAATSSSDHSAATGTDKGKYLRADPSSGAMIFDTPAVGGSGDILAVQVFS
jgi:hypothetical protein